MKTKSEPVGRPERIRHSCGGWVLVRVYNRPEPGWPEYIDAGPCPHCGGTVDNATREAHWEALRG